MKILKKITSPEIHRWIQLMYYGITSVIENCGQQTKEIQIKRGIRQGCPLSMTLYVLAAEALTRAINKNEKVKRFGKYNKVEQFVDDVTLISPDVVSKLEAIKNLQEYCKMSGQQLHPDKTSIIANIFENQQTRGRSLDKIRQIGKLGSEIKIVVIEYSNDEWKKEETWSNMIRKMKHLVEKHKTRHLTKIGRIRLFNGLILSRVNNLALVFEPSKEHIKLMTKLMFEFIWYPKRIETVSRKQLTKEMEEGGLGVINLQLRFKALETKKIMEVMKGSNEPWVEWALYQLGTKMNLLLPGSYKNRLNATTTNNEWNRLWENLKGLLEKTELKDMVDWRIRDIYKMLNTEGKMDPNWVNILLRKPRTLYTNYEREVSYMVKNGGFKWGDFKRKSESFRKKTKFYAVTCVVAKTTI